MAYELDTATLQAALVGYQQQLEEIETKMSELRRRLGKSAGTQPAAASSSITRSAPRKHRMSAEGRARIAAAQRARWAKAKKAKKASNGE
jgi:hypothetical protein